MSEGPNLKPKPGEVQVGQWYLCAECKQCHHPIPVLHIEKDAPVQSDGSFVFRDVECHQCGFKQDCPLDALQRLQAQAMGPVN